MDIVSASQLPDSVHLDFDEKQKTRIQRESQVIVEGRLSGWLAYGTPKILSVWCDAPEDIRVQRLVERAKSNENRQLTLSAARKEIRKRDSGDKEKYRKLYNIDDYSDKNFYGLVVSSHEKKPTEIALEIIEYAGLRPRAHLSLNL